MNDTAPARKVRERVPLWDNARFACIVLVVMGHAIQRQTSDSDNALTLYLWIYAFHMPAFAIISGYFSKSTPPGVAQMRRVVTDIVLPYLIMQAIWSVVQWLATGRNAFDPTVPKWTLWFLLALAIFRLVLPYLALLRWPLLWAVLASVLVGYYPNVDSTFSLSRAIGILPFFVLGWMMQRWSFVDVWRKAGPRLVWPVRAGALALAVGWFVVIAANIDAFRAFNLRFWMFYDDSYKALGELHWWSGLLRLGLIVFAALMTAAFLSLMPRRETWFTGFGQATMYVYLLHTFVLYPVRESGVLKGEHASDAWLVAMVLAAFAISVALSSPWVRTIFRPLIEPKPRWLFVEDDDRAPAASRAEQAAPKAARRS